MIRAMKASCPGSCGELFQCVVDGEEFLMSYGIEKKSQVVIGPQTGVMKVKLRPKMLQVINELTDQIDFDYTFQTALSVGKGYSSSTADMLSILGAYSAYKHRKVSVPLLTSLCSKIEPSDSVGFSDWTVMNPLNGAIQWQTRWKPKLYVYILEPDQMVDTTTFIRMTDSPLYPTEQSKELLTDFKIACDKQNVQLLGAVATTSALLNNKRLPKPYLNDIIDIVNELGLLGVNVAHSGSVVGILLTEEQLMYMTELEKRLAHHPLASYYSLRNLSKIIYDGLQVKKVEEILE